MSHKPDRTELTAQDVTLAAGHRWQRLYLLFGGLGLLGLAASFVLKGYAPKGQLGFSYLVAFVFWLSIALGGFFFVLVQFASRAGWSVTVRRMAETVMATLPLFLLLFIPVIWSMHDLYHHWLDLAAVARDPLLRHKSPWLNERFFQLRAAVYLLAWAGFATYFYLQSVKQDTTKDHAITRRLQLLSAPGLIVFAVTVSFAAFDWIMSIDPHWYSTIFGVYYFAGCLVAIFSVLCILAVLLPRTGALPEGVVTVEHLHDLGKLLFGFTVFWAYIAVSQFLLYWYGNIPEETIFFAKRWYVVPEAANASKVWPLSTWRHLTTFLALGHFVVPFLFLLPRTIKRHPTFLLLGACWMLLMHLCDTFWLIMPNLHKAGIQVSVLDLTTLLGVGGIFLAGFFWLLRRQALVPVGDPRLPEALRFENF
ncbi:MAG: hypothetical protein ABI333_15800 [bacterium]